MLKNQALNRLHFNLYRKIRVHITRFISEVYTLSYTQHLLKLFIIIWNL